jgi:hypothetical protein
LSWDLEQIREGAALALGSVPGLRAFAYIPTKIDPPTAIVATGNGTIESFDPTAEIVMLVLVLVSRTENRSAQVKLDRYVSTNTAQSIELAFRNNPRLPYAGVNTCDSCALLGWDAPAKYEVGGIEYFGVQFHVGVLCS